MVPELRIQACNRAAVKDDGEFVLYWMTAYRRTRFNYSLERAVEWARKLNRPLLILEALRCDYRWASDRLHRFVLDGMADKARHLEHQSVLYYPYLEPKTGAGKGLLRALAECACVVITDDFPSFFLPRMIQVASSRIAVKMEKVDSNGLLPMRAASRVFSRAYDFRRFLQANLAPHLVAPIKADPLQDVDLPKMTELPKEIRQRWPDLSPEALADGVNLDDLPIDHSVRTVDYRGGTVAAKQRLEDFLDQKLAHYQDVRNEPEQQGTSGLSPYLHFGHISVYEIFSEIAAYEDWSPSLLSDRVDGARSGWWGMSKAVETFLDELVTWRELGFNMCWQRDDYDRYESLPDWARATLAEHESDLRSHVYSLEEFERARTHDPLWNAAQVQLVREGRIHNYLRMLWGKKILEWTATPKDALAIMIELNNKYALDGRNPNSYSGIFWVLGRYDRAWGPERPIFGKTRYMSSENTARKFRVKNYIEQYAPK